MNDSSEHLSGEHTAKDAGSDFAGLLAKMSSSERNARTWLAENDDPAMQDEIIPLSYEQALKKHARRPTPAQTTERIDRVASLLAETLAERREHSAANVDQPKTIEPKKTFPASEIEWDSKEFQQDTLTLNTASVHVPVANETKAVSITLRMSQQEAAQVRKRAADAGLTMSAYIRSCVCEAELLRAQVKTALIEMRQASEHKNTNVTHPANRPWWNRLAARG